MLLGTYFVQRFPEVLSDMVAVEADLRLRLDNAAVCRLDKRVPQAHRHRLRRRQIISLPVPQPPLKGLIPSTLVWSSMSCLPQSYTFSHSRPKATPVAPIFLLACLETMNIAPLVSTTAATAWTIMLAVHESIYANAGDIVITNNAIITPITHILFLIMRMSCLHSICARISFIIENYYLLKHYCGIAGVNGNYYRNLPA